MFVSITRLRIRDQKFLMPFSLLSFGAFLQAKCSRRCKQARLYYERERGLVFWTATLWTDKVAMLCYRNTGIHRRAMPYLRQWCDEASYAHWETDEPALPDWNTAKLKLRQQGVLSHLTYPSKAHQAGLPEGR